MHIMKIPGARTCSHIVTQIVIAVFLFLGQASPGLAQIVSVDTGKHVYVADEPVYLVYHLQGLEIDLSVSLLVSLEMPDGTICFLGTNMLFSPDNPIWLIQDFPFSPIAVNDGILPVILGTSLSMIPGQYTLTAEVYDSLTNQIIARDQSDFFLVDAPYIDHVEPAQGITGDVVTIHGEMFGINRDIVKVIIGEREATIMEISDSSIVVWVPYGATTGTVKVSVDGAVSNPVDFLVGPYIEKLSATVLEPGGKLTVKGFNFDTDVNKNYVYFNGIRGTVKKASATQLEILVPDGNTGPLDVTVNEMKSNVKQVTITPVVESLTPATGNVDDTITIAGWNFNPIATNNYVVFNAGTSDEVAATVLDASTTRLIINVPAAETGAIAIYTDGQEAKGDVSFTYPPFISDISPVEVMAGDEIVINGLNFDDIEQRNTVSVGGKTLTITASTPHKITARTPVNLMSGTLEVTVNGLTSDESEFLAVYPTPILSTITPSRIDADDTSTTIEITGVGFASGAKVSLKGPSGTVQPTPRINDYNSLDFKLPKGLSPGTYVMSVTRSIAGRTLASNNLNIVIE